MAVEVAVECHRFAHHARRRSGQGAFSRRARHRADFEGHFRGPGEMAEQLADAPEVAAAHLVAYEGVGRVQHGGIVAPGGLQRLEPRMYVLGRKPGFKAVEGSEERRVGNEGVRTRSTRWSPNN